MQITTRTTWLAWSGLMALAAASFGLSYVSLGAAAAPAALGIAAVKAAIIAVIFMRFLDQPSASHVAVVVAVVLMALLIGFVLADQLARPPLPLAGVRHS